MTRIGFGIKSNECFAHIYIIKVEYIFSINTGRAGSKYLYNILATAKGVVADHEPEPKMIGDILELATNKSYKESYKARIHKTKAIKKIMKASSCSTYIETSNMFIKTFFDVVINKLPNTKIVFLKRNFVDTLNSFYQLGYFSDRNKGWKYWMISPYAVTSAIPCLLDENEKDDIGLSLAYLIDIYARGYRFIEDNPNIPVFHITLDELNDEEYVKELFLNLNLIPTKATFQYIGKKVNSRLEKKKKFGSKEISREYLKERSLSYIDKLKANGYDVKDMIII